MCGIAAFVQWRGTEEPSQIVRRMNASAEHRGPDGSGVYVSGGVSLGHTRLSIIDLSDRAHQPMVRSGCALSFNGEIYNFVELREELKLKGCAFTTSSDTEVLLWALVTWGMGALQKLNGMFAFAFYAAGENALYLARDRFGMKPLVYRKDGDCFFAASEAKQILSVSGKRPRLNVATAMAFIADARLNEDEETFFADILDLPAGHFARIDLKTRATEFSRWYNLAASAAPLVHQSYEEARETLSGLLRAAVARHHRADVKVGACLSGGVDSSVLVALSSLLSKDEPLTTITAYAEGDGFDERVYSRSVVEATGSRNIEIEPAISKIWNAELLEDIGHVQDQPISSGSHFNEYCVFKTAREHGLIVMLDGQGADEYFGGYGEFWFAAQMEALRAGRFVTFWEGVLARAETLRLTPQRVMGNMMRSTLRKRRTGCNGIGPHVGRWLSEPVAASTPQPKNFTALALTEITKTSLPYQLHSEDRHSMRWSVESRLPFLDHTVVEYAMNLPTAYKVGRGFQKRILRDAVPELPPTVATRKDKIGFSSPDSRALAAHISPVREQIEDGLTLLGDAVDAEFIRRAFADMTNGSGWYDGVFFRLVSLAAWARAFNATV